MLPSPSKLIPLGQNWGTALPCSYHGARAAAGTNSWHSQDGWVLPRLVLAAAVNCFTVDLNELKIACFLWFLKPVLVRIEEIKF